MGRFLTHIFELQEPLNFVLFLRRPNVGIKASELLSLERLTAVRALNTMPILIISTTLSTTLHTGT